MLLQHSALCFHFYFLHLLENLVDTFLFVVLLILFFEFFVFFLDRPKKTLETPQRSTLANL